MAVENRDLVDQKSALEGELKGIKLEPKIDECSICFEAVSLERKWTAFIPCAECIEHVQSALNKYLHSLEQLTDESVLTAAKT